MGSVLSFGRPKCHFLTLENGHFRQKCLFPSAKKWHFGRGIVVSALSCIGERGRGQGDLRRRERLILLRTPSPILSPCTSINIQFGRPGFFNGRAGKKSVTLSIPGILWPCTPRAYIRCRCGQMERSAAQQPFERLRKGSRPRRPMLNILQRLLPPAN